jgi:hypothetical protein
MLTSDERRLLEPLAPSLRAKVIAALERPLTPEGRESPEANKALSEVFRGRP